MGGKICALEGVMCIVRLLHFRSSILLFVSTISRSLLEATSGSVLMDVSACIFYVTSCIL